MTPGCLTLGYYGEKCSTPCPKNCKGGDCDIVDGTCISCVHGYTGSICNKVCNNNTYGPNCSRTCGHCLYLYGEQCNHVTGQCPRGCASGFQGDLCVESDGPPVLQTTAQVPFYSIITVVVLFSVTFSEFSCTAMDYEALTQGTPSFPEGTGPQIKFSKPYNILRAGDRIHLIEPLLKLGFLCLL
uniref:Endothelial cells scavenger receptor n=1 Tax=Magallana gigas TaxID=29159 RepID=A0A8W8P5I2_MAGGI